MQNLYIYSEGIEYVGTIEEVEIEIEKTSFIQMCKPSREV